MSFETLVADGSTYSSTGHDPSQSGYTGVMNTENHPAATAMVSDASADAITSLAKELNVKLDDQTKDYLMQYYLDEKKAANTQLRQSQAEKDYYPNLVEGLQKAGINPMLALGGLSGGGTGASSGSTTGGLYTSRQNAKGNNETTMDNRFLAVLGMIAVALIYALA